MKNEKMKGGKKFKKAHTLIEIITVVGIFAILTTVVLIFIGDNKVDREIETAANQVYAAVRQAQNYSLTGEGITQEGCNEYIFDYTSGGSSFKISNYDSGVECSELSSRDLGNDITLTGSSISFTAPHGDTTNGAVSVSATGSSTVYSVCSYSSGIIEIKKGSSC